MTDTMPPADEIAIWDQVEREFKRAGFLAPSVIEIIKYSQARIPGWFSFANDLNRLAQSLYVETTDLLRGRSTHDPLPMALQLMPRALSAFQGSIILAERAMPVEAKTLARGIYEAAFWIGYLRTHPQEAAEQLRRATLQGEIGLFKSSLRAGAAAQGGIEAEMRTRLGEMQRVHDALPKGPKLERVAELGGFGPAYLHYKQLSGSAAHVSLKSTMCYLARDDDGSFAGHIIGPDFEGAEEAIYLASYGLITAIEALRLITEHTAHDDEFQSLISRFDAMAPYREDDQREQDRAAEGKRAG